MTMQAFTRGDGLHLQLAGSDAGNLRSVGTMSGVVVLAAAARNGPGVGQIGASLTAAGLPALTWKAPGSAAAGLAQAVYADGTMILEDGADLSKWIRISAYTAYLPASGEASVFLQESFNGLGAGGDVNAANAAAGVTIVTTYTLHNVSPLIVTGVKMWLDQTAGVNPGLSISSDDVSFFTPTSAADPNALTWASIAAGASVNVYTKRVVPAASPSSPQDLNNIQYSWNGL